VGKLVPRAPRWQKTALTIPSGANNFCLLHLARLGGCEPFSTPTKTTAQCGSDIGRIAKCSVFKTQYTSIRFFF